MIIVAGLYVSVHYFKSAGVEVGGINPWQVEVNLRKIPNLSSQTVSTLGAGEFARLTKPVNQWNYFYSVNQQQTIQKKNFKLGYSRVFGFLVLKTKQLKRYEKKVETFAPTVIISLLVLLFLFSLAHYRKRHQKNNSSYALSSSHKKLKEVEVFFYHNVEKEIATLAATYQNNMAEMERTIISLKEKFNDAEKKARILGVNLNDSNIDNLVKGRLFELFAATIWSVDDRTTIIDWTPDKGFNENIIIKSNGNPDFVVSNLDTYKFVAVECKFRSRFKKDKNNEAIFIDFGKEKAIDRYREYQREKSMTVFLLLGVGGIAEHPDNLYLLTLDDIDAIRIKNDCYGNVPSLRKRLSPYKIRKHELIDSLF